MDHMSIHMTNRFMSEVVPSYLVKVPAWQQLSQSTNSKILVAFDDDGNASGDLYIDDGDSIKPTQ